MHTNSHILPPGGQGDARPTARESAAVANAKIISIIDHEVAAAMRLTAKDRLRSKPSYVRQASTRATRRPTTFASSPATSVTTSTS